MTESEPPQAVVDTNLFVSGAIIQGSIPYQVLEAWRNRGFVLITSDALTAEVAEVLTRPRIKERYHLTDEEVAQTLGLLATVARTITPRAELPVDVRDPKDRKVLAAALGGDADYLVTGDNDLLELRGHPALGILQIVTAREFLMRLARV